jgi:hypothetical protein
MVNFKHKHSETDSMDVGIDLARPKAIEKRCEGEKY